MIENERLLGIPLLFDNMVEKVDPDRARGKKRIERNVYDWAKEGKTAIAIGLIVGAALIIEGLPHAVRRFFGRARRKSK